MLLTSCYRPVQTMVPLSRFMLASDASSRVACAFDKNIHRDRMTEAADTLKPGSNRSRSVYSIGSAEQAEPSHEHVLSFTHGFLIRCNAHAAVDNVGGIFSAESSVGL
jgi:hypothetical protein